MGVHFIFAFLIGFGIMTINMIIHAFFMFLILKSHEYYLRFYSHINGIASVMLPLLFATFLIMISCFIQVLIWALVVFDLGKFENFMDAIYFTSTTYTTIGAGKQYMEPPYRGLEPLIACTGMLVAGLNTAILFAVLSRIARKNSHFKEFFG
jgi:uncharacterized membrane protein